MGLGLQLGLGLGLELGLGLGLELGLGLGLADLLEGLDGLLHLDVRVDHAVHLVPRHRHLGGQG